MIKQSALRQPQLIVVMGVSGSGKSTIAQRLSGKLGLTYLEADDFHTAESKFGMSQGQALTSEQRDLWINRIIQALRTNPGFQRCVLACSALKKDHRNQIRRLPTATRFVYLNGSYELIRTRLMDRENHFMPPSLLDSQFDALERPSGRPDTITLSIDRDADEIVADALAQLSITEKLR